MTQPGVFSAYISRGSESSSILHYQLKTPILPIGSLQRVLKKPGTGNVRDGSWAAFGILSMGCNGLDADDSHLS